MGSSGEWRPARAPRFTSPSRVPTGSMVGIHALERSPLSATLASRRDRLRERQRAWRRDVGEDPELYALLGSGSAATVPTPHELSVLHAALTAPGLDETERQSTPRQLIQLLHSPDTRVRHYALTHIIHAIDGGSVPLAEDGAGSFAYHLSVAVRPLVALIGAGAPQQATAEETDVYWMSVRVLQHLCLDEQHAMAVSDLGGSQALVALIDAAESRSSNGAESVNCSAINNILNAVWLVCCYEGDGDLASYDEEAGAVSSLLRLLRQLHQQRRRVPLQQRRLRDDFFMSDNPDFRGDDSAQADPVLVLLRALGKLSELKSYRGQITGAGGIEACVPLLHGADRDPSAAEHRGCAAHIIRSLMVDNSLEFLVLGGIAPVAAMLASLHESEHRNALALCLHLFSIRGDHAELASDMVQSGIVGICCELVCRESIDTRRGGLRLLCLLCEHGPEDYAYLIVQEGGTVEGIVSLLHDDRLAVLQHATALLWYLSEVEDCRERLVHCGGIPAMARLLQRHSDRTLRHNVSGCLGRLECFDDLAFGDGSYGIPPADETPAIQW